MNSSTHKPLFTILACMLAMFTAACDSSTQPVTPIGKYALASMNGSAIPALMFEGEGYSLQTIHGTLEISPDYTYVVALSTLEIVDSNESEYIDSTLGTWTLDAMNALQFTVTNGSIPNFPGTWEGPHVTVLMADGGAQSNSYVFQLTR